MSERWSGPRLVAAIARLKDAGMNESQIARTAGVSRATANRWARGAHRPDHDAIRRLARGIFRKHPDMAKELVEASGYAWAEPTDAPEIDVLAEQFGEEKAARLRRVLAKRGEAGAIVLRALEEEFRSPAEDDAPGESRPSRAAG